MGLEILGRLNWESTRITSIGKGPLNGPYKAWLIPVKSKQKRYHSLRLIYDPFKNYQLATLICKLINWISKHKNSS